MLDSEMNIYHRHQNSKTCVANKFMNNSPYLLKVLFHITLTVFYVTYTTLEDNSRNIGLVYHAEDSLLPLLSNWVQQSPSTFTVPRIFYVYISCALRLDAEVSLVTDVNGT